MKYSTVLFDLDGTLTDPREGITHSVQHALKKYGINETQDNLEGFIGPPLKDSFMNQFGFSEEKAQEAIEGYREYFGEKGWKENIPYVGIKELLWSLKEKGVKLAVATSKPTFYARQIVDHFGLGEFFEVVVGSHMDGGRVHKHEVIAQVLKELELNDISRVLMVGDRSLDIKGAAAHGMDSAGVRYGYGKEGELEEAGAHYIVETPGELMRVVL